MNNMMLISSLYTSAILSKIRPKPNLLRNLSMLTTLKQPTLIISNIIARLLTGSLRGKSRQSSSALDAL